MRLDQRLPPFVGGCHLCCPAKPRIRPGRTEPDHRLHLLLLPSGRRKQLNIIIHTLSVNNLSPRRLCKTFHDIWFAKQPFLAPASASLQSQRKCHLLPRGRGNDDDSLHLWCLCCRRGGEELIHMGNFREIIGDQDVERSPLQNSWGGCRAN